MSKPLIVIVEDEESIAAGLKFNFEVEGYETVVFGDGPKALAYILNPESRTDLVVLDLMLPGMSGYEICRTIRGTLPSVPVLVLSARSLSEDRAYAFDCGTDQYMTKPFALPELLSRIRNLLDRQRRMGLGTPTAVAEEVSSPPLEIYQFDDVTVDFRTFVVRRGGTSYSLTTLELQLFKYFIEHEGTVLSRTQILKDVWDQGAELTTRTIDNFVMRLRKYIEVDPAAPRYLLSVRGTGYRFVKSPAEDG